MCVPTMLAAQNGVTVSGLAANSGTVTFNVSWGDKPLPDVWSDSVWVFVDYNDNGVMKRLPLEPDATLTTHTAPGVGAVEQLPDNNKGVWVVGNARSAGSFSAMVKLLTANADLAGACAYASNYPPVGEYTSATNISFTGTPMYNIVLKNAGNEAIYRASGADFDIPEGCTLVSFTDATGAPGIISCPVLDDNPVGMPNSRCGDRSGQYWTNTLSDALHMQIIYHDFGYVLNTTRPLSTGVTLRCVK